MKSLVDQHGRVVRDLRISVTPRCNFKCFYCDPLGHGRKDPLGTVSVADVQPCVRSSREFRRGVGALYGRRTSSAQRTP